MEPCAHEMQVVHLVLAVFAGINTLLTTYLSLRARRKNREDANGASLRRG